ncbi:MAG TPA: 50S ribosomal protein L13 [Candidatus Polarisedimenticolia bacterium]|jgi:large subunit ribosomal protein L13|nr:50S ribosomal protein L13 [Candidatus Polarisedimenticolia bacterium]
MRTYVPIKEKLSRQWLLVNAEGQTLGRLSTYVASRLMGKHRPTWSPSVDTGDFVVVVNADKVRLTGRKLERKMYRWHTGYPGGLKQVSAGKLLAEKPERIVELAVHGMLPKNRLGRKLRTKLKVYAGPDHPHQAQKPEPVQPS